MIRPTAVTVEVIPDYFLLITFDNGEKRKFDVKPYLKHPAFKELISPVLFATAKPAGLSIGWIHGQDICPDCLYHNSVPI